MNNIKQFENYLDKKQLQAEIDRLEALRSVYSDRDRVRLEQIEKQLRKANRAYLELMVEVA